jgi:uncharacterized Zn-binding protein involved in type VI secretion
MSVHPAPRVTDPFGHDAEMEGLAVGMAVGALLAAGVIATGGLGAIAIGAAVATGGTAAFAGAAIGKGLTGPATGELTIGSSDVFIDTLPATMVERASGDCFKHPGSPRRVATGSASVFINRKPAARVSETMDCGAVILTGSPDVVIGGPRQSPVCTALRGEEATFERFRIDAQAASAAYDPPETRKPPEGYRNATTEDLRKLRLDQSMLEHPIDRKTGRPTEFRAAVFIDNKTGAPLVAYKGTTSGADWKANVNQGLEQDTFYYDQAQQVASRVAESPAGRNARLTGHSLGGGMASAGSRASGLPATTFNPAGLNAKTVPHPVSSNIDEVYVEGEPLHGLNTMPIAPDAAATRTWPLDPPSLRSAASDPRWKVQAGWRPLRSTHIGADVAVNDILLHFMDNVDASLSQRRRSIERALAKNGCG